MRVGDQELFRYSEAYLHWWASSYPTTNLTPYPDYNVARFYEDLIDNLPIFLEPIPAELASYVATVEKQAQWLAGCHAFLDASEFAENSDVISDTFIMATEWWKTRNLPTAYLRYGPDIRIWHINNTVQIRWQNQQLEVEGSSVWTANAGDYTLSYQAFLAEVSSFHQHFMEAMRARVVVACEKWPLPAVDINLDQLQREQLQHEQSLAKSLGEIPTRSNWSAILSANLEIEHYLEK